MPTTQQQLDSLAKGREAKRIKRESKVAHPEELAVDAGALDLLRRMLEGMRVKTILAYKRGVCMACNRPHILGVCQKRCPCHETKAYLEAHGIRVDI